MPEVARKIMTVLIRVEKHNSNRCLTPDERVVWRELSVSQPKSVKQLATRLKINDRTLRYRLAQMQQKKYVTKIGAGKLTFYLRRVK